MNAHYSKGWEHAAYFASAVLTIIAAASPNFAVFVLVALFASIPTMTLHFCVRSFD